MLKIPTLYMNYQELLLDLDIFGKILSDSIVDKDELKKLLFDEYKITHPLPTLEDKRYELSDLVSSDYHISYANEVELAENEQLVDFNSSSSEEDFELEGNIVVPDSLRESYSYGNVTDAIREELISKYLSDDSEQMSEEEVKEVEGVFNTVENHANVYEEPDEEEEYYSDDDYSGDEEEYPDDNYSSEEDDYLDEDNYSEDDDNYSSDEDDSADDNYSEDEDNYSSDEEEYQDDDYSGDEDESYSEDDYSDEDESYSEDDDYFGDEDESYSEDDYSDDGNYSNEEDETYSEDDYSDEGDESYSDDDYSTEDEGSDYSTEEDSSYSGGTDSYEDELEDIKFEEVDKPVNIPTPIDIANQNKKNLEPAVKQPEKVVNRDEEPKDLREFVRKHPRCEVSFALQYFSRKEIEKYILMGKVIKKGTKLHI